MGDKPPANPDDLTAAARTFYAAAEELQRIRDMLTNRTQDLVSGSDGWVGAASDQFQSAWERFGSDTRLAAATLQRTANTLNALAVAIRNVQVSPPGKLVHAIDTGQVFIVSNHVPITMASAGVIHTSDAEQAQKAVSDGYDAAATNGASGFDGAAHATTSGARLAGGAHSAAVGIARTDHSTGDVSAASGESGMLADFAHATTDDARQTHQTRQSDGAIPVAPGIFTSGSASDGASGTAASFTAGYDASSAEDGQTTGTDGGDDGSAAAAWTQDSATNSQTSTHVYVRADLGNSPSDAALAAARQQAESTMSV